jgi:hypothetical protein
MSISLYTSYLELVDGPEKWETAIVCPSIDDFILLEYIVYIQLNNPKQ